MEADTIIREKTKGKSSLDDFCHRFHGGSSGPATLRPFTFDDLVADLNAVVEHDWRSHWTSRLTATGDYAPLKGIENAGWKLAFAAKPTDLQTTREDDEKEIDLTASIGLTLSQEGKVIDVVPGLAAHKAGIGPGMKLIAVNGRRWSAAGMRTALAATKNSKEVLQLLVENDDYFRTLPVTYSEGERYPALHRETERADLLAAICRAR